MKTVTDLYEEHLGVMEYKGIVKTIQTWFYGTGKLVKDSWCATSMSYFMEQLGLLDQLGGKNENVYYMMMATEKASKALQKGKFLYRDQIKTGMNIPRGTIAFMLYGAKPMIWRSSKHVTSVYSDFPWSPSGKFDALGGNQSDGINLKEYNRGNVYALYFPDYDTEKKRVLKRGDKGDEVSELQIDLNELGYPDDDWNKLAVDGSFGRRTEEAVKRLQYYNNLEQDGVCGAKTWAKIKDLLDSKPKMVTMLTDVYMRVGPGRAYKTAGILREGTTETYSFVYNGWIYLRRRKLWISSKKEYVTIQ